LFTYSLPADWQKTLQKGQRCIVPLGRRKVIGYYIEKAGTRPDAKIRDVIERLDPEPLFSRESLKFLDWMAEYYFANQADVYNAALPPDLRKIKKPQYRSVPNFEKSSGKLQFDKKLLDYIGSGEIITGKKLDTFEKERPGLIEKLIEEKIIRPDWVGSAKIDAEQLLGYRLSEEREGDEFYARVKVMAADSQILQKREIIESGISQYRFRKMVEEKMIEPVYGLPDLFDYFKPRPEIDTIVPSPEQKEAIDSIVGGLDGFDPFLLYGITGSGKTLVYCYAAREALKRGKTVLVLVPEIALAGTLLSYFKSFFRDEMALLHSALKPKERVLVWQNIRNGRYRIVIGARSAIFSPLENIGLIIVDEEHDESYKQDDPSPRFQARDAAVMRAKLAGIPVVLGSASPSMESFHNAESGRYKILRLTRRPEKSAIPVVRVLDLKREPLSGDNIFFTSILKEKIKKSLEDKHQVILYLNRRGFSPRIKCLDCGHTPECPHCNISLTYHKSGNRLMCHFCGYINSVYDKCAECGGDNFIHLGAGTQKIEEKLGEVIEGGKIARLDSDSASGRNRAHMILSDFAGGKYNVLLGTQMVTKGIDFPEVELVGVLMADIGLDMPDFRATEKLFAKLIQVSGRSGRGILPGEVVIQTFNPETDLIDDAARQDYDTFYSREIESRRQLQYPPFSHMVNFRLSSKNESSLQKASLEFRSALEKWLNGSGLQAHILGPAPCPLYRLRGMYRRHLFIKTKQILKVIKGLGEWEFREPHFGLSSSIRVVVDIDPYDMM